MKIIIAGGGIGGLVSALSLHNAGYEVEVFESVPEIKPLGVGINLLPHAVRVLTKLKLLEGLESLGVETSELVYANRLGQFFWTEPRGRFAGYNWPQISIHRGKFQAFLWDEAMCMLGPQALHTNAHLTTFEQDQDGVRAIFHNRISNQVSHHVEADILIGADGIHSEVRRLLYPNEGSPVFSGNMLYRGTALGKPFLSGSSMAMIGSLHQKMVIYPIGAVDPTTGLQLTNWVANVEDLQGTGLKERDWNRKVPKEPLLKLYRQWAYDWMDVPEMINQTDGGIFEFPMSDRNPLPRWSFGRVSLLGDAAHPMYPIGSNGASQAILDADALTSSLNNSTNPFDALKAYDDLRVSMTADLVLQNRKKGPDYIIDLMEERFPQGFKTEEIPHEELASIMAQYKKIAGFDKETLNAKG